MTLVFSDTNVSEYAELRFAFRSKSWMLLDGWSAYVHQPGKWISVVLEQTGQNTWKVTLYAKTNVAGENGHVTCDPYIATYHGTTLKDILTNWTNDAESADFFVTDLRGVKTAETNDKDTEKISNLVFSEVYITGAESIPEGFENVYVKYGLNEGDFSARNISGYAQVRFMIKPSGRISVNGHLISPSGDWMTVELVNCSSNSWNVTVGGQSVGMCTGDTLAGILADVKAVDANFSMLVTDLRGTLGRMKLSEIKAIAMSIGDKSDAYTMKAAERLVAELKKITGIELLIEYHEDRTTFDPNKHYIVFGSLALKLGMTEGGITNETGYKMDVQNGHICMYSPTGNGMLNAAYGLLRANFGLVYYTDTVYNITDTDPVLGSKGELIVNHDFAYTWAVDGAITDYENGTYNTDYMDRLGFSNAYESLGGGWHNFTSLVSEAKYGASGTVAQHPEWFVSKGSDPVFVTLDILNYGDAIAAAVADELAALMNARDYDIWQFSPPDYYDADLTSDVYVTFMNRVAAYLESKIDRKVELMLLAYQSTFAAPSVYFAPNEKVSFSVMVAPIECNYYYGFDNTSFANNQGKTNAWYYEQIRAWGERTTSLYVWNYSAYFDNYFVPLDTITNMQNRYRDYKEAGITIIHDQGVSERIAPDWSALKLYLKSELAKDVEADVDALIDRFMVAYYGEAAAPFMKQLLQAQQAHYATIAGSMRGGHITRDSLFSASLWSKDMLATWYGYIRSALNATTDETLRNRIQLEALTIRYLRQVLHTTVFDKFSVIAVGSTTASDDSLAQIIADAKLLGIERFAEGSGWICNDGNPFGTDNLVDGSIDNLR